MNVTDAFNNINRIGTINPNPQTGFPATSTSDSFFGNVEDFGGQSQPEAQIELGRLNMDKDYKLSFFGSRMDVSDNRETQFIVSGDIVDTLFLNVSNNTDKVVTVTLKPNTDGRITIHCSPGPNNNNSNHFYYLGAMKMTYDEEPQGEPEVTLLQPNGNEIWQANKLGKITWLSKNVNKIFLEYSVDNGVNWSAIDSVMALTGFYFWHIPNVISNNSLIKISSNNIFDISDSTFSITDKLDKCTIVVLGSSTAEGTGANPIDSSWVNRYKKSLADNSKFEIINLARGGYTTYHIVPNGTVSPGINIAIDTSRNITKAISLNPYAIIVNMPSNDATNNFTSTEQMKNFRLIYNEAKKYGIQTWICTTQPRNLNSQSQIDIQKNTRDSIFNVFGDYAIDFWNGIADDNGFIKQEYNSGDGVHLNNAGHKLLFEKVSAKKIDTFCPVYSTSDYELKLEHGMIKIYPNPNFGIFNIESDNLEILEIKLFTLIGQEIEGSFNNLSTDKNNGHYNIKLKNYDIENSQLLFCNIKIATENGIKYISKPLTVFRG